MIIDGFGADMNTFRDFFRRFASATSWMISRSREVKERELSNSGDAIIST